MSQLNNNTAALQALLEAVEALPEAGGGGGELKYATGTVKVTSMTKTLAFSGLDFEPVIVMTHTGTTDVPAVVVTPQWNIAKYGSNYYRCSMVYNNGTCTLTASGNVFYGISSGQTHTWHAWGF